MVLLLRVICVALLLAGCGGGCRDEPARQPGEALPELPSAEELEAMGDTERAALVARLRAVYSAGRQPVEACRAALQLSRLEAVAANWQGARSWAERARGFSGIEAAAACVEDATWARETLSDLARPAHAGGGKQRAAELADGDRSGTNRVRLEDLAVYGAAHGDGEALRREVRVVLRFSGPAVYRRGELPPSSELPRRIVLDLDGVSLPPAARAAVSVDAGGLRRIRSFPLDDERVRVSFDVEASTEYRLFVMESPFRLVLDFRGLASGVERRTPAAGPRIVLDPGHGGAQPGARGPDGLKESTVALSLARRVRASLHRRRPELAVLMTRDEDDSVSLEERTAIANSVGAELFVSIHLNASDSPEDKGGVSTFVLDTSDDEAAVRLAARENGTDAAGVTALQKILASLYRADQVEQSLDLARLVHRSTLHTGRKVLPELNDRGVKRALFYVLVGATMPAILIEASFITEPREAAALATDAYRDALSEGIADGVLRYLDARAEASGR